LTAGFAVVVGFAAFGNAAGADHLDVVVHQRSRGGRVAQLNQVGKSGVNFQDVLRQLGRGGGIAARPGYVLERDQLHHQHAIVGRLGDREVKVARQPGKDIKIVHRVFGFAQQAAQVGDVGGGGIFGGEFSAKRLDRALGVHDFGSADAGEVELHGDRLG